MMQKKIHFIGIGGIGMSALAEFCLSRGSEVSGSDLKANSLTERLADRGADIRIGHSMDNLSDDVRMVVVSTGVRADNPELVKASLLGIEAVPRMRLLKEALEIFPRSIGVTGTHGKTTTSGLISHILWSSGEDPSAFLGGESVNFQSNFRLGSGDSVVAEIDESDGYFRELGVDVALITNIEKEHLEHYSDFEDVLQAYRAFVSNVPEAGLVIYNSDDRLLEEIVSSSGKRVVSFGRSDQADIRFDSFSGGIRTEFDLYIRNGPPRKVSTGLLGEYNVMNILAAVACCITLGIDEDRIIAGIESFSGMRRRFEVLGDFRGIKVVEDYAHHPTEIRSVLSAAKKFAQGRVIAVFQPHRYTRTLSLLEDFKLCFEDADMLFLADIYPAGEKAIAGVESKCLLEGMKKELVMNARVIEKSHIAAQVAKVALPGDIVLVLGAGDICEEAEQILKELHTAGAEVS